MIVFLWNVKLYNFVRFLENGSIAYFLKWVMIYQTTERQIPENSNLNLIFKFLAAVVIKSHILCDIMPCSQLKVNGCFRGAYRSCGL
jgi:hypothetical protein